MASVWIVEPIAASSESLRAALITIDDGIALLHGAHDCSAVGEGSAEGWLVVG